MAVAVQQMFHLLLIFWSIWVLILLSLDWAVASFPRASLGRSSRGWAQPSSNLVSKTGGGNRKGGRGGRREVEQLQHGHSHTAAACEHAGGCHPFVAAWVVFLYRIETWTAIVPSNCVQPAIHGHKVVSTPGQREGLFIRYKIWYSSFYLILEDFQLCSQPQDSKCIRNLTRFYWKKSLLKNHTSNIKKSLLFFL